MGHEIEPVVDGGALLGEGPLWDAAAERLWWVDITRRELHCFDPVTGKDSAESFAEPVTALAPAPASEGGLIAAVGGSVVLLGGDHDTPRHLATLPTGDRANDGACDPAGRFLIGTLTESQLPGACGLYRIDGPQQVSTVLDEVTLSNGLDWSPDGRTLYFVDTPTRAVDALDYDPERGTATGRRRFIDLRDVPGRPDGLTVDAEGGVWVALIRGGEVRRYDAHGRLDTVIGLPARRVTSCAFGGPGLEDLYVTSGRFDMTEQEIAAEPLAGALFRVRPGVAGKPAHTWRPF